MKQKRLCLLVIFAVLGSFFPQVAATFPFRTLEKGESIPESRFESQENQRQITQLDLRSCVAVIMSWDADLLAKKSHSIAVLRSTQRPLPFFMKNKIKLLSIYAQGDPKSIIQKIAKTAYSSIEKKADRIVVLPSILVPDKDSRGAAGVGRRRITWPKA